MINLDSNKCLGFSPSYEENVPLDLGESDNLAGREPLLNYPWHFLTMVSKIGEESLFHLDEQDFDEEDCMYEEAVFRQYVRDMRFSLTNAEEISTVDLAELHNLLVNLMDYLKFFQNVRKKFSEVQKMRDLCCEGADRKRKREEI